MRILVRVHSVENTLHNVAFVDLRNSFLKNDQYVNSITVSSNYKHSSNPLSLVSNRCFKILKRTVF